MKNYALYELLLPCGFSALDDNLVKLQYETRGNTFGLNSHTLPVSV